MKVTRRFDVSVNDCTMQHGPVRSDFELSRLMETVACYRKINPDATIVLTVTETPARNATVRLRGVT